MAITYRNAISIAELVVYIPALAIALFLCSRHGFGRSSAFWFLVIFTLARIIGPCMELATISHPFNLDLYEGVVILQSVGLSPLMMSTLGLLSRLLDNIQKSTKTLLKTRVLKLVELLILVALILGIAGGIESSSSIAKGSYNPNNLVKAGIALFIISFVAIVVATIMVAFYVSHADKGEKRIFVAVAISIPFILVRLIYSIMVTYTHVRIFNQLTGSPTALLCVALLEEFIVVIIYEGIGVTLPKVPKPLPDSTTTSQSQGGGGNVVVRVLKRTVIGKAVTYAMEKHQSKDDIETVERK